MLSGNQHSLADGMYQGFVLKIFQSLLLRLRRCMRCMRSPISCCVGIKWLELQPFIEFNFGLTAADSEVIKRQIHDTYCCNIILCVRAPCIPVSFEVMLSRPLRRIVTLKALSSDLGQNHSQSSFSDADLNNALENSSQKF